MESNSTTGDSNCRPVPPPGTPWIDPEIRAHGPVPPPGQVDLQRVEDIRVIQEAFRWGALPPPPRRAPPGYPLPSARGVPGLPISSGVETVRDILRQVPGFVFPDDEDDEDDEQTPQQHPDQAPPYYEQHPPHYEAPPTMTAAERKATKTKEKRNRQRRTKREAEKAKRREAKGITTDQGSHEDTQSAPALTPEEDARYFEDNIDMMINSAAGMSRHPWGYPQQGLVGSGVGTGAGLFFGGNPATASAAPHPSGSQGDLEVENSYDVRTRPGIEHFSFNRTSVPLNPKFVEMARRSAEAFARHQREADEAICRRQSAMAPHIMSVLGIPPEELKPDPDDDHAPPRNSNIGGLEGLGVAETTRAAKQTPSGSSEDANEAQMAADFDEWFDNEAMLQAGRELGDVGVGILAVASATETGGDNATSEMESAVEGALQDAPTFDAPKHAAETTQNITNATADVEKAPNTNTVTEAIAKQAAYATIKPKTIATSSPPVDSNDLNNYRAGITIVTQPEQMAQKASCPPRPASRSWADMVEDDDATNDLEMSQLYKSVKAETAEMARNIGRRGKRPRSRVTLENTESSVAATAPGLAAATSNNRAASKTSETTKEAAGTATSSAPNTILAKTMASESPKTEVDQPIASTTAKAPAQPSKTSIKRSTASTMSKAQTTRETSEPKPVVGNKVALTTTTTHAASETTETSKSVVEPKTAAKPRVASDITASSLSQLAIPSTAERRVNSMSFAKAAVCEEHNAPVTSDKSTKQRLVLGRKSSRRHSSESAESGEQGIDEKSDVATPQAALHIKAEENKPATTTCAQTQEPAVLSSLPPKQRDLPFPPKFQQSGVRDLSKSWRPNWNSSADQHSGTPSLTPQEVKKASNYQEAPKMPQDVRAVVSQDMRNLPSFQHPRGVVGFQDVRVSQYVRNNSGSQDARISSGQGGRAMGPNDEKASKLLSEVPTHTFLEQKMPRHSQPMQNIEAGHTSLASAVDGKKPALHIATHEAMLKGPNTIGYSGGRKVNSTTWERDTSPVTARKSGDPESESMQDNSSNQQISPSDVATMGEGSMQVFSPVSVEASSFSLVEASNISSPRLPSTRPSVSSGVNQAHSSAIQDLAAGTAETASAKSDGPRHPHRGKRRRSAATSLLSNAAASGATSGQASAAEVQLAKRPKPSTEEVRIKGTADRATAREIARAEGELSASKISDARELSASKISDAAHSSDYKFEGISGPHIPGAQIKISRAFPVTTVVHHKEHGIAEEDVQAAGVIGKSLRVESFPDRETFSMHPQDLPTLPKVTDVAEHSGHSAAIPTSTNITPSSKRNMAVSGHITSTHGGDVSGDAHEEPTEAPGPVGATWPREPRDWIQRQDSSAQPAMGLANLPETTRPATPAVGRQILPMWSSPDDISRGMSGLSNMVGAASGSAASGVAAEGPFSVADAPLGYKADRYNNTGHMDGASGAGTFYPVQQLPVRRAVTAVQTPELRQFHVSRGRMLVDNLPTDVELNVSVVNNPQAPTPFGPAAQMVDVIMCLDIANNTLAIEAFKDNRAMHVQNTLASGMASGEPGPGGHGGGAFGHNGNHHNDAHGGSGDYYEGSDYGGVSAYNGGNGYQSSYHGDNNVYQGGYHGGSGYQDVHYGGNNGWQYGPNEHAQGYRNGHDGRADSYQSGGQGSAARYAPAMRHTAQSTETNGTQRWVHDHRVRMAAEGVILEQPVCGESSRIPDDQGSGQPSRNEPTAVHAGLALRGGTTAGGVVAKAETVDPVLYMPSEGPSSYGPPMGQLPESAGARTTRNRAAGSTTTPMAAVAGHPAGTDEPEMTGFTIKLLNVDGQMQYVLSSPQETKVLTRDHAKARPLAAVAAQAQPSEPAVAPGEGHGATSHTAVAPVAPTPAHNEEAEGAAKLKRARRKASKKAKKVVAEAAGAAAVAEAVAADPVPLAEGGGKSATSTAKPPPSEKREGTGAGRPPRGSRAGKGAHKGEASDADVAATAEACLSYGEEEWDSVVSRGAKALSRPWRFADI